jgi:long-chain acyl-CoA synthetase
MEAESINTMLKYFKGTTQVVTAGETLPQMFWNAVKARGDRVALRQKEFGIWRAVTWREFGDIAREVGMGLVALGFEPGECISILSNTRKEWLYADLGALIAAGVSSGIYPTDSATQVEYLMLDSDSKYIFVEDEEQLDKVLKARPRLAHLRKIIVFDMKGLRDLHDEQVISLDHLRNLGRIHHTANPEESERLVNLRKPNDLAILIYTSGTTGKPKGVMISHHNIIHSIRGYNIMISQDERDERMCFLPLCHVVERFVGGYAAIYTGTKLNFVENPETIPENVREISPTVFIAVPRIWEKFYSAVTMSVAEATRLQQWAYRVAIDIGHRVAQRRIDRQPIGAGLASLFWLARTLVLNNVRRVLGIHRCRFLVTGAAPISPDLVRWYLALGIPMCEGYGQTESMGGGTFTPIDWIKPGMIGVAAPYNEVRISDQGELLIRGDNVLMGYLNQPEKTAETIRDGWLYTGDVGYVDADGFFKITDRMKDIIITAGGKNITPSEIENQIKFSPYITDAVVIGDRRPYLTCLIMIDQENVEKYAQDHSIPFSNYASLCRAAQIQALIQSELDRVNKQFSRVEQVKKFRLIEQKLTAEDEELTPTMKLKRKLVSEKYRDLIESMYASTEPAAQSANKEPAA